MLQDCPGIKLTEYNNTIKYISWLVYYKQCNTTTELVNYIQSRNESVSLLLGDKLEHVRSLTLACFSGCVDMVKLLLKFIDFDCIYISLHRMRSVQNYFWWCHRKYTPLTAASTSNVELISYLHTRGADINSLDSNNWTPLLMASWAGRFEIVEFLINLGADIIICDHYNVSPLSVASEKAHMDIARILINNGADINFCNSSKESPIYKASREGHNDIVKLLTKQSAIVNLCD